MVDTSIEAPSPTAELVTVMLPLPKVRMPVPIGTKLHGAQKLPRVARPMLPEVSTGAVSVTSSQWLAVS